MRRRERNAAFDESSESSEIQIFVKEPAPNAVSRNQFLGDSVNNDNNVAAGTHHVAPVAAPLATSATPSGAATELRTLMRQQEEILQALNGLRKAVESGMRTLNARVRTVEETLQDLMDAVDERNAE